MKDSTETPTPSTSTSVWQKTPVANLIRYVPSGTFFARLKVDGKLIRRSLETKVQSTAKLRLADLVKAERQKAEHADAFESGKMTFGDALETFRQRFQNDASLKPRTKAHKEERIATILKTWPDVTKLDVARITKQDCLKWAAGYQTGASNFNKTVQTLRSILEIAVEAGVRYDNPARFIKAMRVRLKPLQLPGKIQFQQLVDSVRVINKRFSHDAAVWIEFLAYGGFRLKEAKNILWSDCDFERGTILVRGDKITGTKNWTTRTVPMISKMRKLLEKLKTDGPPESPEAKVMKVSECRTSLANACQRLGIPKMTHHGLRHLFATTCHESGVDAPTYSRWMGHKDGGVLAMKVYGHLRDEHSTAMAEKVQF